MNRLLIAVLTASLITLGASADPPKPTAKVEVGSQAPVFKILDASGKLIDLAELTAKGPVLVRLTCGCSGCDKELAYFQALHDAYKKAGLTSLAVFKEPDAKVAAYVKEKNLNMLYAVGLWYKNFSQTTDEEVRDLLERAAQECAAVAQGV